MMMEEQYEVSSHIDKKHIHNHVIFNSTTLDCEHKFRDFRRSGKVVRHISDLLCVENGLSIIDNPGQSRGSYDKWLGDEKVPSWKSVLKQKIDEVLPACSTYEEFLQAMRNAGFTVNTKRKYVSFLAPGQKKPTRMMSLGDDYTDEAIRSRLGIGKAIISGGDRVTKTHMNLLIDIQAKILEGKGAGYEHWAKVFNVKQAAKTLIFLKENGIDSFEDLKKRAASASGKLAGINGRLREIEERQKAIAELQRHIGTYGKTKEIYAKYKASGWSRAIYDVHSADIILHKAAKRHFNKLGMKKLPTIAQLKQEYSGLTNERKALYSEYHKSKELSRELVTALHNAEQLLGITPDVQRNEIVGNKTRNYQRDL